MHFTIGLYPDQTLFTTLHYLEINRVGLGTQGKIL